LSCPGEDVEDRNVTLISASKRRRHACEIDRDGEPHGPQPARIDGQKDRAYGVAS
jgi:hypothetical protein